MIKLEANIHFTVIILLYLFIYDSIQPTQGSESDSKRGY